MLNLIGTEEGHLITNEQVIAATANAQISTTPPPLWICSGNLPRRLKAYPRESGGLRQALDTDRRLGDTQAP